MEIKITSNADAVAENLAAMGQAMTDGIARALDYENEMSVGQIQAIKLSRRGPTTLGVISNRLRSSVRPTRAIVVSGNVDSSIGSNVIYAAVHEYGIDQMVAVPAHTRKVTVALRGGSTFNAKTGRIKKNKPGRVQTGVASVGTYSMHMHFPARRYIGSTVESRKDDYVASINSAALEAWRGGQP